MNKLYLILITCLIILAMSFCTDNSSNQDDNLPCDSVIKVTFIELGSDNCIPCKNMRPVMDSIQKKYGDKILVKFIDVLKNSKEAEPFKIRIMPTQVFLDSCKNEIHRHEGFYPEDSIHLFLQSKGMEIIKG
jgi:thioredoxin 1